MKLLPYNMGCGPKFIEGYVNVDGLMWKDVTNIIHNLTKIPYPFVEEFSADEILAVEVLEHISFKHTVRVLEEWYRILKVGGVLKLQVPDCGKAMEYYVNKQICSCVPHKSIKGDSNGSFKSDHNCFNCNGRGKINPNRWLFSFTGAGKHKFDHHLNIFTKDILLKNLEDAGFKNITFKDDIYKLKVTCVK